MSEVLVAVALAFAFVNGVNDGGAVVAVGLDVRTSRPLTSLVVLTLAVAVAPQLLGTAVATTLTSRLVAFDGPDGPAVLLVAVIVAVVVTWGLAARGLPTSLTLAVVGAIAGSGVGARLPVAWDSVAIVLGLGVVAPIVGFAVAWVLTRVAGAWPSTASVERRTKRWHLVSFAAQCVAYGANDGQKMLAVLAVAAGTATSSHVPPVGWQLAAVSVAFLLGAMVGLPRIAATLSGGVVAVRSHEAVTSQLASATVVLTTGALGSPVSMTQTVSGGLIGAGVTRGTGRVRWNAAVRLVLAWVVTLPAAAVLAAVAGAIVTAVR